MRQEDILKQTKDALDKAIEQKKLNQDLLRNLGPAVIDALRPVLDEIAKNSKLSRDELLSAISQIKIDVPKADVPKAVVDVKIPEIIVPAPKVTIHVDAPIIPEIKIPKVIVPKPEVTVNVPPIKIPDLQWPKDKMPIEGWVQLMGVSLQNPLPVQLRDANGKPVNLLENLTTIIGGGGGGGKSDFFTIKGFSASAYADYLNADNRLRVSVETGGSGLTDSELRASAVPMSQVSGAIWSVNVVDAFGSASATSLFNADNRLRVSVETGGSGLTDGELRASSVPIEQVSGSMWSTYVTGALNSLLVGYESGDGRIKVEIPTGSSGLTDAELRATSVPISQVSGARWSTEATQGTSPWVVSATDLDVRDLVNATDSISAYQVSGHRWSTEATQSGTWTVALSGSLTSSVVVGPTPADTADDGNAPIQIGGIARTANPTAVAGNDVVKSTHDDLGRQLIRPMQVRDLTITAYATLTTGTETTLLAATVGSFHDLIYIMGANNSDAAVTVDIRPVLAGNVVMSVQIPANGTAGVSLAVPYPQSGSDTGNAWTADMGDLTGTTVYLSALFSREV